ncbi:MAG TPA: site-specific DNA-methyltransferase [Acholeplasmataceae bacterium]|jgi:site-specific DNA-methyltransferase (adenine-specific)|nr:site-specific DNA-methyltransferase [Acholeplasmataceae bacterium]
MDLNIPKKNLFFKENSFQLLLGDSFSLLKKIPEKSIDMIFADPPYFLSNGGISVQSGKMVSVNKATWDMGMKTEDKLKYNRRWIKECKRVLKDDGTIWISGTMHNIYYVGVALELEGFSIINNVTWQKTNPPPNISTRAFTHSTETILWARKQLTPKKKGKHLFNYQDMKEINGGKQMKDVWQFSLTPKREKQAGKFPTQKPLALLERIILSSTKEGDLILDPFNGSGTTGIAAYNLNRRYIGIDLEKEYLELTKTRYNIIKDQVII